MKNYIFNIFMYCRKKKKIVGYNNEEIKFLFSFRIIYIFLIWNFIFYWNFCYGDYDVWLFFEIDLDFFLNFFIIVVIESGFWFFRVCGVGIRFCCLVLVIGIVDFILVFFFSCIFNFFYFSFFCLVWFVV